MTDAAAPETTAAPDRADPEGPPRFRPLPLDAEFRVPSDDAGEHELVAANARARAHSATVLRRLLPESVLDGALLRPQPVDRPRLARLFDLDALDALVDHGVDRTRVMVSNLAFLGDGANVSLPAPDRVHGALVGRALRDGGRVVLPGLERSTPAIRRFAEHLGRVLAARVAVRAVAGSGAFSGETSAPVHRDHLLVPVVGQRHVTVEHAGTDAYHGALGPGEALYLPAGATLTNHPANELFVLLEVQLDLPSPRNLLPAVADDTHDDSLTWSDDFADLRDRLTARWLARLPALPATPFSRTVRPGGPDLRDGWVRPVHTGGWCRPAAADDVDTLVAAGVGLAIPRSSWPLLATGLAGPAVPVASVATDAWSTRLVALLVDSGLCELLAEPGAGATWDAEDGDAVAAL